jgi:hypothetical protein
MGSNPRKIIRHQPVNLMLHSTIAKSRLQDAYQYGSDANVVWLDTENVIVTFYKQSLPINVLGLLKGNGQFPTRSISVTYRSRILLNPTTQWSHVLASLPYSPESSDAGRNSSRISSSNSTFSIFSAVCKGV